MAQQKQDIVLITGENFARTRKALGITQAELAERTGLQQAAISRFERGLSNPTLKTLEMLAEGIGTDLHIGFLPQRSKSFTLTHMKKGGAGRSTKHRPTM